MGEMTCGEIKKKMQFANNVIKNFTEKITTVVNAIKSLFYLSAN
jgi:hypothetical protein